MRQGLKAVLKDFLRNGAQFLPIQWDFEALQDRMVGFKEDCLSLKEKEEYFYYLNSSEYDEVDTYLYVEKFI